MFNKVVLLFAAMALLASAGTVPGVGHYSITLAQPAMVQGTVLKAGDYRLNVAADRVTITGANLKKPVQATVKLETEDKKFDETVLEFDSTGGKMVIANIRLAGTKTKLIFN